MLENLKLGFIILLTGIVIVFFVLFLLIGIIKLYSTIVYNFQNSNKKEKNEKNEKAEVKTVVETVAAVEEAVAQESQPSDGSVPGEIVAAIAAAVEVIFGQGAVKIKSIKKSSKRRSAWKSAGVAENTRSF